MNTKVRRMFTSDEIVELIQGVIGYGIVKLDTQETSGTFTDDQMEVLLNDDNAVIVYNNKRYQKIPGYPQYAYNFYDDSTLTTSLMEIDSTDKSWEIVGA